MKKIQFQICENNKDFFLIDYYDIWKENKQINLYITINLNNSMIERVIVDNNFNVFTIIHKSRGVRDKVLEISNINHYEIIFGDIEKFKKIIDILKKNEIAESNFYLSKVIWSNIKFNYEEIENYKKELIKELEGLVY